MSIWHHCRESANLNIIAESSEKASYIINVYVLKFDELSQIINSF